MIALQIMLVVEHGFRIDKHRRISAGDEILMVQIAAGGEPGQENQRACAVHIAIRRLRVLAGTVFKIFLPSVAAAGEDPQMAQRDAQSAGLIQPLGQTGKNDVVFQRMGLIDKLQASVHRQDGNGSAVIVGVPQILLPVVNGGDGSPEKRLKQIKILFKPVKKLRGGREGAGNAVRYEPTQLCRRSQQRLPAGDQMPLKEILIPRLRRVAPEPFPRIIQLPQKAAGAQMDQAAQQRLSKR